MSNVKLYNGDCLEVMDKLIVDGVKVDAIITDPPFGTTSCSWDSVISFDEMWKRLNKLIKDNGAIALFSSEPFSTRLKASNLENYKYDWYWNKENSGSFATAKYKPLSVVEQINVFTSPRCNTISYYPIMEKAQEKNKRPRDRAYLRKDNNSQGMASGIFRCSDTHNENLRYPKNLLTYNNRVGEVSTLNRVHPTQKPIALMEYLVKTYTQENETVLDFTMGSGSTIVACLNTNRNAIGIELDENYFKIAEERINKVKNSIFDL